MTKRVTVAEFVRDCQTLLKGVFERSMPFNVAREVAAFWRYYLRRVA